MVRAFGSFAIADPAAETLLDEWIEAMPESAAARLARGRYLARRGWGIRGGRWAADTPRWRFQQMVRFFERAVEDLAVALDRNPRLVEGYWTLQGIARATGSLEDCREITQRALEQVPASFQVYWGQLACMLPRWGGSYEQMNFLFGEIRRQKADNPRLAVLEGYADWDRARVSRRAKRYSEAMELVNRALAAGDHWLYYRERSEIFYRQSRYHESWADLERAMKLLPGDPSLLVDAVYTLNKLRRVPEVVETLELLEAIDPGEEDLPELKEMTSQMMVVLGHQEVQEKQFDRALELLDRAASYDPGNHEAYYWRGRARLLSGDDERALGDFRKAIEIDPRHYHSYVDIDWILARRGQWEEILRHWNDYLALEPSDAKAYLERAGTNRHAGRPDAALADLLRACRLNSEEACRLYERERFGRSP